MFEAKHRMPFIDQIPTQALSTYRLLLSTQKQDLLRGMSISDSIGDVQGFQARQTQLKEILQKDVVAADLESIAASKSGLNHDGLIGYRIGLSFELTQLQQAVGGDKDRLSSEQKIEYRSLLERMRAVTEIEDFILHLRTDDA